ncbi:MAG: YlbF family regulator [Clostridia bacterium]|nr:YlbF family regulator [Clostridia bacterium]MBR6564445.1 YlbF family regulator [Clostridia bacterium]
MDVTKIARELGKAIQQDERFIRYAKAKLANDNDTDLQAAIGNFNIVRMELEKATSTETLDQEKIKELNEQLRKVYGEIMSSAPMVEYNTAKALLDQMMNDINVIISKSLEGEDPDTIDLQAACTGSCSTCGGCH